MKYFHIAFLVVLALLAGSAAYAQNHSLQGKVLDSDGNPMIGASVVAFTADSAQISGTITDIEGRYLLTLKSKPNFIKVSYIGYLTENFDVAGKTELNVVMVPSIKNLEAVVVTALGMKREKKALGYAVKEVRGDDLNNSRDVNVVNSLSGRVSGLNVISSGTGEWGSKNIVLRGFNSLSGSNQPLIVVDGIPISGSSRGGGGASGGIDYGNGMSDINPDDIESMSVLKGANASALYGSRAANGVIVITTKKGKKDSFSVDYNLTNTFTDILNVPEMQNQYGRPLIEQPDGSLVEKIDDVYSWGTRMDGQEYINWRGEPATYLPQPDNVVDFYQRGFNLTNSLAVSMGNETSNMRISYANTQSESIIPNSELTRNNVGFFAQTQYNDFIEVSGKANYYIQEAKNRPNLTDSPDNPMYTFLRMPRNIVLADLQDYKLDNGFPRLFDGKANSWDASTSRNQNPYWTVNENMNSDNRRRFMGMASVKLNFTDNFNLLLRAGTDYHVDGKEVIVAKRTAYEVNETRSKYSSSMSHGWENNYDFLFSYNKKIKDFGLDLSAGGNTMYQKYESIGGWGTVLLEDRLFSFSNLKTALPSQGFSQKKINSLYAMGSFDYKRYLFLELTGRNDWSSTLPPENNSYQYYSASISSVLTEMFEHEPYWLTFSKIRASAAQVGNDTNPYSYTFNYNIGPGHLEQSYGYKPFIKPLYDLKPEITTAYEIGTENHLFMRRLSFDFTYYYTETRNQILSIASPVATGFSAKKINAGRVSNRGVEIELSGKPIVDLGGANIEIGLNLSRNRNYINELYQDIDKRALTGIGTMSVVATAGGNYGDIVGKKYARDEKGRLILDSNGMPEFMKDDDGNDLYILGNIQPDFMGGMFLNANWNGIEFSAVVNYKFGGEFYSFTDKLLAQYGNSPRTLDGRDAWAESEAARIEAGKTEDEWSPTGGYDPDGVQLQGDGTYSPTAGLYVSPQKYWNITFNIDEEFVHDASYVKLNQMRLAYRLPDKWIEPLKVSEVSLGIVGNNLFYIWKAVEYGLDPEASFNGYGIEYSSIPTTRNYGFNLNVKF